MWNSRQDLKGVELRRPAFASKPEMKHSIVGRGYVAEDTFVRDIVPESVRIDIECLQGRHPVDVDVEGGQFFAGRIGCYEVEVEFVYAGVKRYVVHEIADAPLSKEQAIAGSGDGTLGTPPWAASMHVLVCSPDCTGAVGFGGSAIARQQANRHGCWGGWGNLRGRR